MPSSVALDHLVWLVPYKWLGTPPEWLSTHFTITPGGVHSNGKTANSLIIFKAGFYIEMIAFVDDRPDHWYGHKWGEKKFGWCDWALTYDDEEDYSKIMDALDNAEVTEDKNIPKRFRKPLKRFHYDKSVEGGRTQPDGTEIEWKTTFPAEPIVPGSLPFFCKDVTSRELRVPVNDKTTSHPCKAAGINDIHLCLFSHDEDQTIAAYNDVFATGDEPAEYNDLYSYVWNVRQPIGEKLATVTLSPHEDDDDEHSAWGAGQASLMKICLYAEEGVELSNGDSLMTFGPPNSHGVLEPHNKKFGGREFIFSLVPRLSEDQKKKRRRSEGSSEPEVNKSVKVG